MRCSMLAVVIIPLLSSFSWGWEVTIHEDGHSFSYNDKKGTSKYSVTTHVIPSNLRSYAAQWGLDISQARRHDGEIDSQIDSVTPIMLGPDNELSPNYQAVAFLVTLRNNQCVFVYNYILRGLVVDSPDSGMRPDNARMSFFREATRYASVAEDVGGAWPASCSGAAADVGEAGQARCVVGDKLFSCLKNSSGFIDSRDLACLRDSHNVREEVQVSMPANVLLIIRDRRDGAEVYYSRNMRIIRFYCGSVVKEYDFALLEKEK